MSPIKVMVADDDAHIRSEIRRYFSLKGDVSLVAEAGDGLTTLKKVWQYQPDVLLLDVVMPQLDGLGVLQELSRAAHRPYIIIHTSLRSEAIIDRALRLGADYYMLKPVGPECLYSRVVELMGLFAAQEEASPIPENILCRLTRTLGLRPGSKSTLYTEYAAQLVFADPSLLSGVTKRLYPQVANAYHTSSASVEHAIREAAHISWTNGMSECLQSNLCRCPSNIVFLSLLAEKMHESQEAPTPRAASAQTPAPDTGRYSMPSAWPLFAPSAV